MQPPHHDNYHYHDDYLSPSEEWIEQSNQDATLIINLMISSIISAPQRRLTLSELGVKLRPLGRQYKQKFPYLGSFGGHGAKRRHRHSLKLLVISHAEIFHLCRRTNSVTLRTPDVRFGNPWRFGVTLVAASNIVRQTTLRDSRYYRDIERHTKRTPAQHAQVLSQMDSYNFGEQPLWARKLASIYPSSPLIIQTALDDASSHVRRNALMALAQLEATSALTDKLIYIAQCDPSYKVRICAIYKIFGWGDTAHAATWIIRFAVMFGYRNDWRRVSPTTFEQLYALYRILYTPLPHNNIKAQRMKDVVIHHIHKGNFLLKMVNCVEASNRGKLKAKVARTAYLHFIEVLNPHDLFGKLFEQTDTRAHQIQFYNYIWSKPDTSIPYADRFYAHRKHYMELAKFHIFMVLKYPPLFPQKTSLRHMLRSMAMVVSILHQHGDLRDCFTAVKWLFKPYNCVCHGCKATFATHFHVWCHLVHMEGIRGHSTNKRINAVRNVTRGTQRQRICRRHAGVAGPTDDCGLFPFHAPVRLPIP